MKLSSVEIVTYFHAANFVTISIIIVQCFRNLVVVAGSQSDFSQNEEFSRNSLHSNNNNLPLGNYENESEVTCPPIPLPRKGIKLESSSFGITENHHRPGTVVKYSCMPFYEPIGSGISFHRLCLKDGRWTGSNEDFSCASGCGLVHQDIEKVTCTNGKSYWPWHATIYRRQRNGTFSYHCKGTLISRRAILTTPHCVNFFPENGTIRSPDSLRVYLGKYTREQMNFPVQMLEVYKIIVHPNFTFNAYGSDIVVVILKQDVVYNNFIQPICTTQKSDFILKPLPANSIGTVAGFEPPVPNSTQELKTVRVSILSRKEFEGYNFNVDNSRIKSNLFGKMASVREPGYFSGSGMYFQVKNKEGELKWYLKAVAAATVNGDSFKLIMLPDLEHFMTWIASTVTESIRKIESGDVESASTCPAIKPRTKGIKLECISKMSEIKECNCQKSQPAGTVAKYSCLPFYEPVGTYATINRRCRGDGRWTGSNDIFFCASECGIANQANIPFITNGKSTSPEQWPWHAVLFLRQPNGIFEYRCGGTLIGSRAVLTAAHCVADGNSQGGFTIRQAESLRVYLGKHEREQADEKVQMKNVIRIQVYPSYNANGYDSDIAVIFLDTEVTSTYFVRPICIPKSPDSVLEQIHLSANSIGTVVGFGATENGHLANDLRMARLRVLSPLECSLSLNSKANGRVQIKSTTFCAHVNNKTNVCNGDSGSGMYFPSTNTAGVTKWYLQGLVSVGISKEDGVNCDPSQVSIFTRVGKYATWIADELVNSEVEDI